MNNYLKSWIAWINYYLSESYNLNTSLLESFIDSKGYINKLTMQNLYHELPLDNTILLEDDIWILDLEDINYGCAFGIENFIPVNIIKD